MERESIKVYATLREDTLKQWILFTHLNRTEQAELDLMQMWERCHAYDQKMG